MGNKLLNRFIDIHDHLILRVQWSNGSISDMRLPNESAGVREEALAYWGGASVPYAVEDDYVTPIRVDGCLVADIDPDTMSTAEFAEFDRADELRGWRKVAVGANDADILAIMDEPMNHNQRYAAMEALATA